MRKKIDAFLNNDKDYPLIAACICGFYVLLFYYSNNYSAINSISHLLYFFGVFVVLPCLIFGSLYYAFGVHNTLVKYRKHLLFVLIIMVTATMLSQAMFLTLKKKVLLGLLIISMLSSIKLHKHYKKLLLVIALVSILPLYKCVVHIYEHSVEMNWMHLPDNIKEITLKHKPNIYLIQPDGYVSRDMLQNKPYEYQSDLFNWLEDQDFKVYDGFRSNYPASLSSNASLFAMKQHRFNGMQNPTLELPNARAIISGNNPVLDILKNNNYHTSFIVQDEYFQQNRPNLNYDHYNITFDEIPFFSNDNNVKKVVFDDLSSAMNIAVNQPRFYFVEKLLPHHVHFSNPQDERRAIYLNRIDSVNVWLKNSINHIVKTDKDALIIIMADHGGWLGLNNYHDMYTSSETSDIKSIYASLLAIRWNELLYEDVDEQLNSHVNLFRILFSSLAENKSYLKHLEDNSSYNLHKENHFFNSVYQVIDDNGNVVYKPLNN